MWVNFLLDFLLPKEADVLEIEGISEDNLFLSIPQAPDTGIESFKALFQYRNRMTKTAIWEIKYRRNEKIAEKFSKLLHEFMLEEISDEILFSNLSKPMLIPIPASQKTLKERGFNQCELIVKGIERQDKENFFEIDFHSLKKVKETPHQSKLSSKEKRLKNLKGCFSADEKVRGRFVILIDDVYTTGATMKEASETLYKAGARKVVGFALAH